MSKPSRPFFPIAVGLALSLARTEPDAREVRVPEPLRPWTGWVLDRNPGHACPTLPDGGKVCVAYASLDLDLGDKGGTFRLRVAAYGAQWVALPGDAESWPMDVKAGSGGDVAVVARRGSPQAKLPPGEHTLTGRLAWPEMPGSLGIPPGLAQVALRLRGRPVARPEEDGAGKLLLESKPGRPDSSGNVPLSMRVFRKLEDGVPMRMETRIRLTVSGPERQILTGRLLPPSATPLSIESDLPVRVEPDGRLRIQLLPGDRTVTVASRFLEPVPRFSMERQDSLWPVEEIWTFAARPEIRVVELTGAPIVDASQSGLPEAWKSLPAYRLAPGDTLRLEEKQRGDLSPQAGTLDLNRQMWLDFTGRGFTWKDRIGGRLYRRSRLEMGSAAELGRAELNGEPVVITVREGKAGVETAAGPLQLVSVSRGRTGGALEAAGWNQSFKSIRTVLHLPPGWSLLHAEGPDRVGNSWISDWSLWDVFLVCILTLAILRLAGRRAALLACATFVLLSQERGLGGLLWLNLLAGLTLWKVLPPGRFRALANAYRWAGLLLLAALWVPFAMVHARMALYPQLDGPGGSAFRYANVNLIAQGQNSLAQESPGFAMEAPEAAPPDESPQSAALSESMPIRSRAAKAKSGMNQSYDALSLKPREARYAKVQTGPGEPAWAWESAWMNWSGPVREGETFRLFLAPPWAGRIGRALQACLPGILLLVLAVSGGLFAPGGTGGGAARPDGGGNGPRKMRFGFRPAGPGLAVLLLAPAAPARGDFPPDSLLREMEERLLAPPECAPACASLNAASVVLAGERMRLSLFLDAADTAVAPLPQAGRDQLALEGIRMDDRPAPALRLANGGLAAVLPPGRHRLILEGRLLGSRLELAFGEEARNLSADAPGYSVQGLRGGRAEGGTLVFQRREAAARAEEKRALLPDPVLPFVEVHRALELAQEWAMVTRVIRIAPATGALSVEIPLPAFEHPLSRSLALQGRMALVSFQEGETEVDWRSAVDRRDSLLLVAGDLGSRAETWQVRASSRWHLDISGLAPVQAPPGGGETEWKPMPGDSLALRISEPKAAGGAVKTIESATLSYAPARHESSASLSLSYRAGQGDAARVTLPPGARLERLMINGSPQPLTQREGILSLPLRPGVQEISLEWKQPEGIGWLQKTPRAAVGDAAANVSLALAVPGDRWILWVGGPQAGPALLLWGVLAVLLALAYGLGRSGITPLGFRDWALLFAGTCTVNVYVTAPLLALFILLRLREKGTAFPGPYNLWQAVLGALALLGFGLLLGSVPTGLLSSPDMQVTGNGSYAGRLQWFIDRAEGALPSGWMFSLPLWAYRLAMLAWSLWLAFRLLGWLRWCWERYTAGGLWKKKTPPRKPDPAAPAAA